MNVIETNALCKRFGRQSVLHDVSFKISAGRIVGFLGPNGAGKTTTIKILTGLLKASSGDTRIFDLPIRKSGVEIRRQLGYLPGDVHLYGGMKGLAFLRSFASARGVDCLDEAKRLADVLNLELHKRIRSFSTGMRQKLGLIQALMHKPRLLILDEPTSALDPLIRAKVFEELKKVAADGRTILFSSHSLSEVETLCDEVIILRSGKIVEQQDIEVLRRRALRKVRAKIESPIDVEKTPDGLRVFESDESSFVGTWSGKIRELLRWVEQQPITDLIIEKPDLNDLFVSYYSESAGENANV